MAMDATILRAGTAIKALVHAQMPIAADVAIDMATWKMSAKVKLPTAVSMPRAQIQYLVMAGMLYLM